ncbi:MAG: SusC/RagA family TonB-linked outer membrane protein [Bacteroidales bacterium]|nr:SusC/RagA family TonB-linked outer membrane protein [Bacteroidales bacterium]
MNHNFKPSLDTFRIRVLCFMTFLMISGLTYRLFAQQTTPASTAIVTGSVVDSDNEPLYGALVVEKGTNNSALVGSDGTYSIKVQNQAKAVLQFSFIGMKPQDVPVRNRSKIDVKLESNETQLSEVVVTGYGNVLKEAYTGSATVIAQKELENRPAGSFENLLAGVSPGLVTAGSGQPGDMAEVRLRGFGSLSSDNQPLYVIDGVVFDQMSTSGHSNAAANPMTTINPADIASISVLKDAASASLYGSQGANGVIVITTKKGSASDRVKYSFSLQTGVAHVSSSALPQMANSTQFRELWTEAQMHKLIYAKSSADFKTNLDNLYNNKLGYKLDGKNFYQWEKQARNDFNTVFRIPKPGGGYYDYDFWGADEDKMPNTNWFDEITRNALFQQYNLSISGGSNVKYSLSLGYFDQEGVIRNSNLRRYSGRFSLTSDNRKKLINWGAQANASATEQSGPLTTGTNYNMPHFAALLLPAVVTPYLEDGSYNFQFPGGLLNTTHNPIASAKENIRKRPQLLLFGSAWLRVNFTKWLDYRFDVATYYILGRRFDYFDQNFGSGYAVNGELTDYDSRRLKTTIKNMLNFNYTINERHRINAIAGVETIDFRQSYHSMVAVDFLNNNKPVASTGSEISSWTSSGYDYSQFSIISRADYSYRYRYFINGSFRQDRSSRLSPSARVGNFWSVSAAYRITNEHWKWIESIHDIVNNIKFKVSYGYNGTLPSSYYSWRTLYSGTQRYDSEHAMYQTFRASTDLSWEKNKIFNVGVDINLFNDRIKLTAEWYQRKSADLLQEVPVSQTSGYSTMLMNTSAGINNKGFELDIKANILDGQFRWDVGFNLATLSAKYYGLDQDVIDTHLMRNGESVSTWYMYKFAGIDSFTGSVLYYGLDENGNDIISSSENPSFRRIVGKGIPSVTGGLNTNFGFRGWELSALFSYGWGHHVLDSRASTRTMTDGVNIYYNMDVRELDRWTPDNIFASNPIRRNGASSSGTSTRFLHKGDYLKLKSIRLQYLFPSRTFRKIGISNLSLFGQVENLFVLTEMKGYDPDLQIDGYINAARYPSATTYSLGLNLNF